MNVNPYQSPTSPQPTRRSQIPIIAMSIPPLLVAASLLGIWYIDLPYDYPILSDKGNGAQGNALRAAADADILAQQLVFALFTLLPSILLVAVEVGLILNRRSDA